MNSLATRDGILSVLGVEIYTVGGGSHSLVFVGYFEISVSYIGVYQIGVVEFSFTINNKIQKT